MATGAATDGPFWASRRIAAGFGASHRFDGYAALCFPQQHAQHSPRSQRERGADPFLHKELITDSGGPGRRRGGIGQEVAFVVLDGEHGPTDFIEGSIQLNGRSDKGNFPLYGRGGGGCGRGGGLWLNDAAMAHGVYQRFWPEDRVRFQIGGGGGFGDAFTRELERVAEDVRAGLVSAAGAQDDYGVVIDPETGAVDVGGKRTRCARPMSGLGGAMRTSRASGD